MNLKVRRARNKVTNRCFTALNNRKFVRKLKYCYYRHYSFQIHVINETWKIEENYFHQFYWVSFQYELLLVIRINLVRLERSKRFSTSFAITSERFTFNRIEFTWSLGKNSFSKPKQIDVKWDERIPDSRNNCCGVGSVLDYCQYYVASEACEGGVYTRDRPPKTFLLPLLPFSKFRINVISFKHFTLN